MQIDEWLNEAVKSQGGAGNHDPTAALSSTVGS